jgi:thiamine pyrophosphate-dependent acetolactate synthase large subunit-like protein
MAALAEAAGISKKQAVASGGTSLIEVIVEPRANVYPMIPAGKHVSEMYFK